MKLSPLQVKHYHFTALSVMARPDVDIEKLDYGSEPYPPTEEANIRVEVSLGEPSGESDPHQFVINLNITCNPGEQSHFPYLFAASLEGVFTINHEGDLEERKRLVVCNGASMLYGAAREQLLSLTARHRYGPMLLPAANFNGLAPAAELNEKKPPKKRKAGSQKSQRA
jgi:preprotein translocase subunit SecB